MVEIIAYTDGACSLTEVDQYGNSYGKGGYGIVIIEDNKIIHTYNKGTIKTTNNAEELKAIATAIEYVKSKKEKFSLTIYSDSAYCVNIFSGPTWARGWEKNNWKRTKNQPIKNLKLIQYIWHDIKKHNINVVKVKGHNNVLYNEMADKLAVEAKLNV